MSNKNNTNALKSFKKMRLGYERMLRAQLQEVEASFAIDNMDAARLATANVLNTAHKLDVISRLCIEKTLEKREA